MGSLPFFFCHVILFAFSDFWDGILQIFVGNLDANVTDDHLRQVFGQYGELVHVKIPVGKRCGFVQFSDRLVVLFSFKNTKTGN